MKILMWLNQLVFWKCVLNNVTTCILTVSVIFLFQQDEAMSFIKTIQTNAMTVLRNKNKCKSI